MVKSQNSHFDSPGARKREVESVRPHVMEPPGEKGNGVCSPNSKFSRISHGQFITYNGSMLAPEKINVVLLLLKLVVTFTSTVFVAHGEVLSLDEASEETRRAVDASWPMQLPHKVVDTAAQYPLYHQYMKGCYDAYTIELCDENEAIRIERNTHQPLWVPRNFTAGGYAKVPAPVSAYKILRDFWDTFAPANLRPEVWDAANIYTNHWSSPTEILLLDPPASPNGMRPPPQMSTQNRQKVIEQVQEILERWTGVALQPTSLYGIRSYTKGSILSPHVDRYVWQEI